MKQIPHPYSHIAAKMGYLSPKAFPIYTPYPTKTVPYESNRSISGKILVAKHRSDFVYYGILGS
ncbi:hypothetical protein [Dyadobacter tibetensis]|uniref:hypothetical protein n=1 Tax=Dyadobacter tibetensis TaxID=1211851 RepID=UPI00046FEE8F|nr:hypothetical protein [Dyadobacter tibetensis]